MSVFQITLPPAVGSEEFLSDYFASLVPLRIYWVTARYGLSYRIYLVRNGRCGINFGARFIRVQAGMAALEHKLELVDLTGDKAQNWLIASNRFYIKIMMLHQKEQTVEHRDLYFESVKRAYQEKGRQAARQGLVTEQSQQLFTREMMAKVTVEFRDVNFD